MTVDYRTRCDTDVTDIDITEFFSSTFANLLDKATAFIGPWLADNAPEDMTLDCEGICWHLSAADGRIQLQQGVGKAGLRVALTASEFSGMVNDLYTPMTFFASGSLNILRGEFGTFLNWWLIVRAVVDQRPIHVPGSTDFHDRHGAPLNLNHAFCLEDSLEDMRHFLETTGFIHIAGVFSAAEMSAISADIDKYHDNYYEGDDSSWWATTKNGERRLVRLQRFDQFSAATRSILQDPRFKRIGGISGDGHVHCGLEGNAIEALIKPLDVVQGISDLPWHKDCSLGRHSYDCCSLTVGISVTAHLSCTHHMAQAPTARERRVMYTSFRLPSVTVDSSIESRARINQVREAAYKTVSQ